MADSRKRPFSESLSAESTSVLSALVLELEQLGTAGSVGGVAGVARSGATTFVATRLANCGLEASEERFRILLVSGSFRPIVVNLCDALAAESCFCAATEPVERKPPPPSERPGFLGTADVVGTSLEYSASSAWCFSDCESSSAFAAESLGFDATTSAAVAVFPRGLAQREAVPGLGALFAYCQARGRECRFPVWVCEVGVSLGKLGSSAGGVGVLDRGGGGVGRVGRCGICWAKE